MLKKRKAPTPDRCQRTIYMSPETNRFLNRLAEREGLTRSAYLSNMVRKEWRRVAGTLIDELTTKLNGSE